MQDNFLSFAIPSNNRSELLFKAINSIKNEINNNNKCNIIISDKISKNNCRALFGGEGADELFGGYETYRQDIQNLSINNSCLSAGSDRIASKSISVSSFVTVTL